MGCELTVLETVFAFEEASVVRADVRRERVLPEAHLAELVRRHAVGSQRDYAGLEVAWQRRAEFYNVVVRRSIGRAED